MTEKSAFGTNFSRFLCRYELKLLGYAALFGSLLIIFVFCSLFRPYLVPLPTYNIRLSVDAGLRMPRISEPTDSKIPLHNKTDGKNISQPELVLSDEICKTEPRTVYCNIKGDVRVHGTSGTVFFATPNENPAALPSGNSSWRVRPYARQEHAAAMRRVREWTLETASDRNPLPHCTHNHSVPAVLFSLEGLAGNHFHDFSDYVIPLYLTSTRYNGEVQFLVTNRVSGWIEKFHELIKNLSHYNVIYIDEEDDVHCFENVIIGLERHSGYYAELTIESSNSSPSMSDFRQFIREAYSLKKSIAVKLSEEPKKKPRILIVLRKKTRAFVNANKILEMAERVGFEVVTAEANMSLSSFSQVVNSCDVMMGVHGAGLTNMVFLPDNAVLVQIVPIGGLEWYSKTDFGDPAKWMNLRYLEYKINPEESTLMQRYPADHEVLRHPTTIWKQGYMPWKSVYLIQQNVILDVYRFSSVLMQALELLHQRV